MKALTDKQKKIIWIVAAILIAVHFAPGFIAQLRQLRFPWQDQPAPAVLQKPSAGRVTPAPQPPPPPPSPEAVAATKYGGIWTGHALIAETQDTCQIKIEIVPSDTHPGKLTGYESKSCFPTPVLKGGKIARDSIADLIRMTSPVSAVLTGTAAPDGGLTFTVDKTMGTQPGACELTSFTITPFGQGQVQAQWQEGTCSSGQMQLTKAKG
jgi:hypothetical protein